MILNFTALCITIPLTISMKCIPSNSIWILFYRLRIKQNVRAKSSNNPKWRTRYDRQIYYLDDMYIIPTFICVLKMLITVGFEDPCSKEHISLWTCHFMLMSFSTQLTLVYHLSSFNCKHIIFYLACMIFGGSWFFNM